jgi:hypothetical protein
VLIIQGKRVENNQEDGIPPVEVDETVSVVLIGIQPLMTSFELVRCAQLP